MHGDDPVVQGFDSFDQEIAFLKQTLHSIQADSQTNAADETNLAHNRLAAICIVFQH